MLYARVGLINLSSERFANLFSKVWSVTENKSFEVELLKDINLFGFEIDVMLSGVDHAGFDFEITLFGYSLRLNFYDNRHWDSENNCWE